MVNATCRLPLATAVGRMSGRLIRRLGKKAPGTGTGLRLRFAVPGAFFPTLRISRPLVRPAAVASGTRQVALTMRREFLASLCELRKLARDGQYQQLYHWQHTALSVEKTENERAEGRRGRRYLPA